MQGKEEQFFASHLKFCTYYDLVVNHMKFRPKLSHREDYDHCARPVALTQSKRSNKSILNSCINMFVITKNYPVFLNPNQLVSVRLI